MKKTAVIGASPNPARYSYQATLRLHSEGHHVLPLGINPGIIGIHNILDLRSRPSFDDVDTVTMYLAPHHQMEWKDYIFSLKPNRIIFNPGAENSPFADLASAQKIEVINACTLVMLSVGNY